MSHPAFIHIYSNGDIWYGTEAIVDPKVKSTATGTLVSVIRVNTDASLQKIATLTGSGNSSSSALATIAGTGAAGDKFKAKEMV